MFTFSPATNFVSQVYFPGVLFCLQLHSVLTPPASCLASVQTTSRVRCTNLSFPFKSITQSDPNDPVLPYITLCYPCIRAGHNSGWHTAHNCLVLQISTKSMSDPCAAARARKRSTNSWKPKKGRGSLRRYLDKINTSFPIASINA